MDMTTNDKDVYKILYPSEYVERRKVSCMLPVIPGTNKLSRYLTCKVEESGKTQLYVIKKPHIIANN